MTSAVWNRRRAPMRPVHPRHLRVSSQAVIGGLMLAMAVLAAVLSGWVSPHSPVAQSLATQFTPPAWERGGTWRYPLGTDEFGRDVLSRILYGARISVSVGVTAVLVGGGIGTCLGLIAGFSGRWLDDAIMRVADIQLSVPFLILCMAVIAVIGRGLINLIIVLGAAGWVTYARVVRAEVLRLRTQEFTTAAEALGATSLRIATKHLLPNAFPLVIVIAGLEVAKMILAEASLSFLGLGVPPPTPTWGSMVSEGLGYVDQAWWLALLPGIAIAWTVLGVNLLGDWLHARLDPRGS